MMLISAKYGKKMLEISVQLGLIIVYTDSYLANCCITSIVLFSIW